MNKKALLTAVAFAIFAMVLLFFYQRRFEDEASGGDKVKVFRLVKRLDRGSAIAEDALAEADIPLRHLDERVVKAGDKSKIIGLTTVHVVPQQAILMWPDLISSSEEQRDLSRMIEPGSRGFTIRVTRDDSSVALIHPGDKVDVVATMAQGSSDEKTAIVLLQGILVLAVGTETTVTQAAPKERARDLDSITLSLGLQQIQLVRLASERGRLAVAVRSNRESDAPVNVTDMKGSALLGPQATARPSYIAPVSTVPIEVGGDKNR
jgi:pilus assembly protein CpaB